MVLSALVQVGSGGLLGIESHQMQSPIWFRLWSHNMRNRRVRLALVKTFGEADFEVAAPQPNALANLGTG